MKQAIIVFLLFFFLNSCIKEESTVYKAIVVNPTKHTILILPFKNGAIRPKDTILLNPNTEFKIAHGVHRGLIEVPLFFTDYLAIDQQDSIMVVFDTLFRIIHYNHIPPLIKYPKHYLVDSKRNLVNLESYEFHSIAINKHSNYNTHIYTFTEQDYKDAQ